MAKVAKRIGQHEMNTWQILLIALILDYIWGEPDWIWRKFPHPAVFFGRVISFFEQRWNKGRFRLQTGFLLVFLLVVGGLVMGRFISWIPDFSILEIAAVFTLLAYRSLVDHVSTVAIALSESLEAGRDAVSKIVGRDPNALDRSGVSAAAIESAAENFSDGVMAPALWYLVFGLPGLIVYKLVNTADSMIGHLSPKYAAFGYASAKLDDLMNWGPARFTGMLMCAVHKSRAAFELMQAEAPLHRSPNAGWPEGAMAAILDIRLSGPRIYDQEVSDDGYLNPLGDKNLSPDTIVAALAVLQRSWIVFTVFIGAVALLSWLV